MLSADLHRDPAICHSERAVGWVGEESPAGVETNAPNAGDSSPSSAALRRFGMTKILTARSVLNPDEFVRHYDAASAP
jgi:hypothetical protein